MSETNAILVFENTEFDVVDIHNVPWLRGLQVASALGYKNPSADIQNLYDRNSDEFSDEMTQVLHLQTASGERPVRIFSPRGCYLLGMLARTEKAKAFRAWVLDVLEGRIAPVQQRPFIGTQIISAHKHILALMKELKRETTPAIRQTLHAQLFQACRMASVPCPALSDIGHEALPAGDSPLIGDFWELLALLVGDDDQHKLNHARADDRIALNLLQVQRVAKAEKLQMPAIDDLRRVLRHSKSPRFIDLKAVNSRHAGTVKCWVFEREQGEEV